MESYDTVIVGAGLAGLQCARLLAIEGFKVLLIDRKPSLAQTIHTTGIFVRKTLEDFDLPDYCLGPPVRHVSLFSPAMKELEFESAYDEFRVGRMAPLYDHYLKQCINSGVTWRAGTSYADHSNEQQQVIVNLVCGSSTQKVATRYLIGADGARSRVAKDLKLDLNRHWIVGVERVFANVPLDGPPRLFCFLDPELAPGYIGWVAHDGEEAHVGVGGHTERFDPLSALSKFQSRIAGIVDLSRAEQLEQRGGRIPVGGVLVNIVNRQGMLIGDAAGAVSPLTAGGLDPCMRLSNLAAKTAAAFLQSGDERVLAAYSGKRFRSRFASRILARRVVSGLHGRFIMEVACRTLRLPILNSLARHVFFGRGSFPDVPMPTISRPAIDRN